MKKDNGTHRIRKGILAVFMKMIRIRFINTARIPLWNTSYPQRNPGSIYESDPDHFLAVLYFPDDLDAVLFVKRKEGI